MRALVVSLLIQFYISSCMSILTPLRLKHKVFFNNTTKTNNLKSIPVLQFYQYIKQGLSRDHFNKILHHILYEHIN